jgi:ribulose 1,5-bisphosphate synthetase/thiazole synthase
MSGLTNGNGEIIISRANDEYNRRLSVSDDIPVLIVGGGPSGLLLAYMLSKLGSMYKTRGSKKLF